MDRRQVEVWRHIEPSRTNEPGRVIGLCAGGVGLVLLVALVLAEWWVKACKYLSLSTGLKTWYNMVWLLGRGRERVLGCSAQRYQPGWCW